MNDKIKLFLLSLMITLLPRFVSALPNAPDSTSTREIVEGYLVSLFNFFQMDFLTNNAGAQLGLIKFAIFVIVLILIYNASAIGNKISKKPRLILSIVFAFMALMVPNSFIMNFWKTYTSFIWLIIYGFLLFALFAIFNYVGPEQNIGTRPLGRFAHLLRILLLLLAYTIVNNMGHVPLNESSMSIFIPIISPKIKRWLK